MRVECVCTDKLDGSEVFPHELPMVPLVGHRISSAKNWGTPEKPVHLTFFVASVTWGPEGGEQRPPVDWIPYLEVQPRLLGFATVEDFYRKYRGY